MSKKLVVLACIIVMSGCSTNPVSTTEAKSVPDSRVFNKNFAIKKSGTGEVIIKRDSGILGSPCDTKVYLDGMDIADLSTSEKLVIYPTIGEHIISAKPNGICVGGLVEASINVIENKTIIYRVGYGSGGDFGMHPTAF
ncbi:hypothetical protein EKN56_12575 [Limnobaculum zhutongyuii]|uniref:Lipoprotein n=1 Tax=Limnobaculum zhutongyuii TaxID=2498113 RepID=A0A411WLQ6_9GAMM|nr:hypothetical protein [Limnobaculum zhutongyuii]QBH97153.1 hypothetical protein EKN56_12575 [Limnobaculum zhutongyuii]TQS88412.1 hypothetical protein ELQ32_10360 [Limnobaculum zhutongyuii]